MVSETKKIAILSGKGGTGKTLLAVNLAYVATKALYVDCDVEEPNGHLFLKPQNIQRETVTVKVPVIDDARCTECRNCVEFCKFHALAYIQGKWMHFDEVCHACGGCVLFCKEHALTEKNRSVGSIEMGNAEHITVISGMMTIGESSGMPIIKQLLEKAQQCQGSIFIDCPPGSACTVMESIKGADYCLLVAEPTLFGAHNLELVYELVKLFQKPYGVIINKYMPATNPVEEFCIDNHIPIIAKLPFDAELGKLNSNGMIAAKEEQCYHTLFADILRRVMEEAERQK